jgi:hypothetical protein
MYLSQNLECSLFANLDEKSLRHEKKGGAIYATATSASYDRAGSLRTVTRRGTKAIKPQLRVGGLCCTFATHIRDAFSSKKLILIAAAIKQS